MPIYEYNCKKCNKTIEVIQKFSDPVLKKHEGCGGQLTKLISAAGFQFKGTGWYVTDYARKSGSESSAEKAETKAETKDKGSKSDAPSSESATDKTTKGSKDSGRAKSNPS